MCTFATSRLHEHGAQCPRSVGPCFFYFCALFFTRSHVSLIANSTKFILCGTTKWFKAANTFLQNG